MADTKTINRLGFDPDQTEWHNPVYWRAAERLAIAAGDTARLNLARDRLYKIAQAEKAPAHPRRRARCPICKMHIRGAKHVEGMHHTARATKGGK